MTRVPDSVVEVTRASRQRPGLDEVTERALIAAYQRGDRRAGDRLVGACLPFVTSIALEYRRWGAPLEDLVQEGSIGLLLAIRRFDDAKACRLVTYAAYWIRAQIRDYVMRSYRVVRFGTTKNERRAVRLFRTTREDDPAKLAEASGLSLERATQLLPILMGGDVSMDAASPATGVVFGDRMSDGAASPEERASHHQEQARAGLALSGALAELTERERLIARERWSADDPQTLEALGKRLGVSKERVRQIEERARVKLRGRLAEVA